MMLKNKTIIILFGLFMGIGTLYGGGYQIPTNLSDSDVTDQHITLQWTGDSNAVRYGIYQFTGTDIHTDGYTLIGTTNGATTFVVQSLDEYTLYQFAVTAVYNDGIPVETGKSDPIVSRTTHTWSGDLLKCVNSELHTPLNHIPTRTELESVKTAFSCQWTAFSNIDPLEDLISLTSLNLQGKHVNGSIPGWIGNLAGLTNLDLSSNNFTGAIPNEIANLTGLTNLNLSANALSGTIPAGIRHLTALINLDIHDNNITGTIPSGIEMLTMLSTLDLSSNKLIGSIPTDIGNLTALTTLKLGWNSLDGHIPESIGTLIALTSLDIAGNHIMGTIPSKIGDLSALTNLDLSDNSLTGTMPDTITQLTNLTDSDGLRLYDNCRLKENSALKAFIDQKSPVGMGYDYIFDHNEHCSNFYIVPIICYLLN